MVLVNDFFIEGGTLLTASPPSLGDASSFIPFGEENPWDKVLFQQ
jgi:hypothetical protein